MKTPTSPTSPAGIAVLIEPTEFIYTVVNNILTLQRSYTVDSATPDLDLEASSSDSTAIEGHKFDLSGTLEITIIL